LDLVRAAHARWEAAGLERVGWVVALCEGTGSITTTARMMGAQPRLVLCNDIDDNSLAIQRRAIKSPDWELRGHPPCEFVGVASQLGVMDPQWGLLMAMIKKHCPLMVDGILLGVASVVCSQLSGANKQKTMDAMLGSYGETTGPTLMSSRERWNEVHEHFGMFLKVWEMVTMSRRNHPSFNAFTGLTCQLTNAELQVPLNRRRLIFSQLAHHLTMTAITYDPKKCMPQNIKLIAHTINKEHYPLRIPLHIGCPVISAYLSNCRSDITQRFRCPLSGIEDLVKPEHAYNSFQLYHDALSKGIDEDGKEISFDSMEDERGRMAGSVVRTQVMHGLYNAFATEHPVLHAEHSRAAYDASIIYPHMHPAMPLSHESLRVPFEHFGRAFSPGIVLERCQAHHRSIALHETDSQNTRAQYMLVQFLYSPEADAYPTPANIYNNMNSQAINPDIGLAVVLVLTLPAPAYYLTFGKPVRVRRVRAWWPRATVSPLATDPVAARSSLRAQVSAHTGCHPHAMLLTAMPDPTTSGTPLSAEEVKDWIMGRVPLHWLHQAEQMVVTSDTDHTDQADLVFSMTIVGAPEILHSLTQAWYLQTDIPDTSPPSTDDDAPAERTVTQRTFLGPPYPSEAMASYHRKKGTFMYIGNNVNKKLPPVSTMNSLTLTQHIGAALSDTPREVCLPSGEIRRVNGSDICCVSWRQTRCSISTSSHPVAHVLVSSPEVATALNNLPLPHILSTTGKPLEMYVIDSGKTRLRETNDTPKVLRKRQRVTSPASPATAASRDSNILSPQHSESCSKTTHGSRKSKAVRSFAHTPKPRAGVYQDSAHQGSRRRGSGRRH
jgi:hypothetical protein